MSLLTHKVIMIICWLLSCLAILGGVLIPLQAQQGLTVDKVIEMVQSGLNEDLIITRLRQENRVFHLEVEEMLRLKKAGAGDSVIKVMLDPKAEVAPKSQPGNGNNPAVSSELSRMKAEVPVSEIGVYYKRTGEWVEMLPEVVNWKTGGVLKSVASGGIVKGDVNGVVNGPNSRNVVKTPVELLIYLPEGTAITEYQLLRLRSKGDRREFRTVTGGVFHASGGASRDLVQFEGKKVAARMYEVLLPSIGAGEFGFLAPGAVSSSHASAQLGKIYTFRLLE